MASVLLKQAILSSPSNVKKTLIGVFSNAARNHWNYQYKPGPYPKTAEERAKSAQKYGMTAEEYQPFPEWMGYGDYPKLPDIGAESKDPHYPYDMPELKRNFNEPIHAQAEIFGEDRYNISLKPRFSVLYQFTFLAVWLSSAFALFFFLEDYKMGRPVTAKQYPRDGPHYLFTGGK